MTRLCEWTVEYLLTFLTPLKVKVFHRRNSNILDMNVTVGVATLPAASKAGPGQHDTKLSVATSHHTTGRIPAADQLNTVALGLKMQCAPMNCIHMEQVNGVSPELTAVATGVPIDPTHSHRRCSPYGTAEGMSMESFFVLTLNLEFNMGAQSAVQV
ncbi:hypothetical protein L3Q82_014808 [Scortum barcoo]|uniref:Uncharacterized protein n=1 Tax=Scortum barcoo TaxID=214431 RepID=A0ACB8VS39_9TELE|nr:hypothetical protein L3Q82_014808 [Scortum barcoo]